MASPDHVGRTLRTKDANVETPLALGATCDRNRVMPMNHGARRAAASSVVCARRSTRQHSLLPGSLDIGMVWALRLACHRPFHRRHSTQPMNRNAAPIGTTQVITQIAVSTAYTPHAANASMTRSMLWSSTLSKGSTPLPI